MKPKILFLDIETTPNVSYTWGKYQQDVIAFKEEWKLLSISYKWIKGKTFFSGLNTLSEKELTKRTHALFDEADIIVAHNGDKFDIKKINAKFLEFHLKPPSPYKTIDTLKVLRQVAKLNSNKLNDAGVLLGLGEKVKHSGFDLWLGCMANDPASWKKMEKYNKQDVILLQKLYVELLPWIKNHPHFKDGTKSCPNCQSDNLENRGYGINKSFKYQRRQCRDCGAWSSTPI